MRRPRTHNIKESHIFHIDLLIARRFTFSHGGYKQSRDSLIHRERTSCHSTADSPGVRNRERHEGSRADNTGGNFAETNHRRGHQTRARRSKTKARRKAIAPMVVGIQKGRKEARGNEVCPAPFSIASRSSHISAMKPARTKSRTCCTKPQPVTSRCT